MDTSREPLRELTEELDALFDVLWPLPRSITGAGTHETLGHFRERMGMEIEEVPSGTRVFDWVVPPVWRIRGARLTGPGGEVVADFDRSNLSVINYSTPVDLHLSRQELEPHLHSLPAHPDAIPYVTSYYKPRWGFCLPHAARERLPEGRYHAWIDSDHLGPGGVPFGQVLLPGESDAEILISSYVCHPSLANNELSGPLALLGVYRLISRWPRRRFSYRFLLNPETIGSLCFLSRYERAMRERMVAGIVLTCVGGPNRRLSYKESRGGTSLLDRLVRSLGDRVDRRPYSPDSGSDERQYGAPGFKLPMGQIARTIYDQYDGYHNSMDDKVFMDVRQVANAAGEVEQLLRLLEYAAPWENLFPYGEPQLGSRGLYPTLNSHDTWKKSDDIVCDGRTRLRQLLWILNGSDGETSMLDVAERSGYALADLVPAMETLEAAGVLRFGSTPSLIATRRPS